MLDNLLDIEVAYSLLRGGAEDNKKDPIDINYEKLKTKIEVWIFFIPTVLIFEFDGHSFSMFPLTRGTSLFDYTVRCQLSVFFPFFFLL